MTKSDEIARRVNDLQRAVNAAVKALDAEVARVKKTLPEYAEVERLGKELREAYDEQRRNLDEVIRGRREKKAEEEKVNG